MSLTRTTFYFDFRSPYSYLASTQLGDLPGEFDWRPFDVLETMKRVGNVPTTVIWTDSAPAWAPIDPALQAFPRQP